MGLQREGGHANHQTKMHSGGSPPPAPTRQPTLTSLQLGPGPVPVPTQPAMATRAELEAAVAALPAKKRRLREAFDRLVACSPVPVPFRWEDLDAHLASVAARFGCHSYPDSLHAAADASAAAVAGDRTAADDCHAEPLEKEELQQGRARRGGCEEGQDSNAGEGAHAQNASLDVEHGDEEGEVREASSLGPDREGDKAVNERVAIEASPEHDDNEDATMGPVVASPRQGDEDIEMVVNANADHSGREDDAEEGEWPHPHTAALGGAETATALTRAVAAACANMDTATLVDKLCLTGRRSLRARHAFLPALLGAADPHALLVRAVGGFLASAGRRRSGCWGNCVALIECVPRLAAPSADALEQAERLAGHWKEMVVTKPRDMAGMAGWGLLTFLASYSIVPGFSADDIIQLFGNIASHTKNNCVDLCKRLGLIENMNDSINDFIENGRPLDAIRLACIFNMTNKYPPLTIMNDYVENAKKTAEEILSKESYTVESLNQVMAKKVDALIFSWRAVDQCNIDPVHRNAIKAEITMLLHKYANKQQSLAGVSATFSSFHQQHNFQEQYQQQAEMQLVEQQQRKPQELQKKPEEEHQHIQNQQETREHKQGWMWQNRGGNRQSIKNGKRKQYKQKQQQLNKRKRLSPNVRQGIHNQRGQSFSGIRRTPFATCTRARYLGPYDHS